MKVVLLAGGFGTRLSEEAHLKPKPMIEIGDKPMLWHIMKIYSHYGFTDFIVCLGYKGYIIKEYFANYFLHESDVTFDFKNGNRTIIHNHAAEPWTVTLVNTGLNTNTGGRLKRIAPYVKDETFMATYGDGVGNVDIGRLLEFHKKHKKMVTVTASQPVGRFGALQLTETDRVTAFQEKPRGDGGWVNCGFFVFEPKALDAIADDSTALEKEPLETWAREGELMAYKHAGFWHPMDSLRDKKFLEDQWNSAGAPWKVWGK